MPALQRQCTPGGWAPHADEPQVVPAHSFGGGVPPHPAGPLAPGRGGS